MVDRDVLLNYKNIVLIGNVMERKKLENCITDRRPVAVVGAPCSGKLCATLDICQRLNLEYYIAQDEELGSIPFDSESVYIIRNPTPSLLQKYKEDCAVVFLCDKSVTYGNIINFRYPTKEQQEEYKRIKGCSMVLPFGEIEQDISDKTKVANHLRGKPTELPENMAEWIAVNFYTSPSLLRLCALARKLTLNQTVSMALWQLVRYPKSLDLRIPPHPKCIS